LTEPEINISRNPSFVGTDSLTREKAYVKMLEVFVAILLLLELILSQLATSGAGETALISRNPSFVGTDSLTQQEEERRLTCKTESQSFFCWN